MVGVAVPRRGRLRSRAATEDRAGREIAVDCRPGTQDRSTTAFQDGRVEAAVLERKTIEERTGSSRYIVVVALVVTGVDAVALHHAGGGPFVMIGASILGAPEMFLRWRNFFSLLLLL